MAERVLNSIGAVTDDIKKLDGGGKLKYEKMEIRGVSFNDRTGAGEGSGAFETRVGVEGRVSNTSSVCRSE